MEAKKAVGDNWISNMETWGKTLTKAGDMNDGNV